MVPSVFVALLLFVGCLTGLSQAFNMTLVHSHDTYGSVVAVTKLNAACIPNSNGSYPPKCYGGVGRRMTFIDSVRATTTNVLLVDTGNILTESPLEAAGGPLALGQFYNSLGYSVLKLGDHDLANPSKLADFLSAVPNATIVASNLINTLNDSNLSSYTFNSYAITTFPGGERVGVCGGVSQNIRVKITASTQLNSTNEVQALKAAVGRLTNLGVNKIVAAIYDETLLDTVLAEVVGIDVLIVHSTLYLTNRSILLGEDIEGMYPVVYQVPWGQPVLVVGSGSYGKYLGKLDLVFDEYGVITGWGGDSYLLTSSYAESASLKSAVVNYYATVVNASYTTQVGLASADIGFQSSCNFSECTVGSWQADKLRNLTQSDIGFINSGSIGGGWSQGPIMAIDVQRVVKYGTDFIYTLSVSGADLLVALENSVSQLNSGRFLQISGLKFSWNANEAVGWRVVDIWLVDSSGRTVRVDNSTQYSVVVLDFVAKGGDGYTVFANNGTDVVNTGYTLYQVVLQALAAETVAPVSGDRIIVSSATRRSCLAPDGTICSNNGVCNQGVCQCYAGSGLHCEPQTNSGTSDDPTTAIVLGTVLPFMFLVLLLALLLAFIAWLYMKRKQARLNLKEPNYQVLVWRREGDKKVALPKTLNSKITDVLEKFLMNETVVKALSGVVHTNRASLDEVSAALVLIHQSANKGTQLIKTLLKHELLSEDEKVLFREETLGVKAFSVFSRMVGLPYLWFLFAYPIAEFEIANSASDELSPRNKSKSNVTESDPTPLSIFAMHNTIEINPKHLEDGQDDSLGRLQLEIIVQKLLTRIIHSLPHFPMYLRQLCHMLYEDMRYDHPDYIHRVLGNLIFLRFICPALLAPQNCGLSKEHTHPKTHRTLILIAKVLQNLANKNDFTGKEEFMEALNGFIHRNIAKVEGFFDGLCAPVAEPQFGDPPTSIVPRQFRKKALLVMHKFVQSHGKELHDELQEFPSYEAKDALNQLAYLTQEVAALGETGGDDFENEDDDDVTSSASDRDELETADEVPTP